MRLRPLMLTTLILAISLCSTIALADVIVQYQTAANSELTPDVVTAGVSAENVTAGSGLQLFSFASGFEWGQWAVSNDNYTDCLNTNDFWSWGFTITDNVAIDLTDFDISLSHTTNGPATAEVRAKVNNGTEFIVLSPQTITGSSSTANDFVGNSLGALPTLFQGDTVIFNLAAYDSPISGGGASDLFILNTVNDGIGGDRSIRINGSITAIPEPGSATLMGCLALTGLGLLRRRRTSL